LYFKTLSNSERDTRFLPLLYFLRKKPAGKLSVNLSSLTNHIGF